MRSSVLLSLGFTSSLFLARFQLTDFTISRLVCFQVQGSTQTVNLKKAGHGTHLNSVIMCKVGTIFGKYFVGSVPS